MIDKKRFETLTKTGIYVRILEGEGGQRPQMVLASTQAELDDQVMYVVGVFWPELAERDIDYEAKLIGIKPEALPEDISEIEHMATQTDRLLPPWAWSHEPFRSIGADLEPGGNNNSEQPDLETVLSLVTAQESWRGLAKRQHPNTGMRKMLRLGIVMLGSRIRGLRGQIIGEIGATNTRQRQLLGLGPRRPFGHE